MNVTIANLLKKFLGDWVETEYLEKFSVSLLSGSVRFSNLKLKPSVIENLALPYVLKCGHIGQLSIETSISSSHNKPINVKIYDLNMLITPREWKQDLETEAERIRKIQEEMKLFQLEIFEIMRANLMGNRISEQEYIERVSYDLVNNMEIEIRNFYIRVEDTLTHDKHFAMGLSVKEMHIKSKELLTTEDKQLSSLAVKRLKIEGMSVYIDFSENYDLISCSGSEVSNQFLIFISHEHQNESINLNHQFLILDSSLSIDLYVNQNGEDLSKPQVSAQIYDFKIEIRLDLEQITRAGKIVQYISEYSEYKNRCLNYHIRARDENSIEEYKQDYKAWLFCRDYKDIKIQEQARELRRKMENIEKDYTYEEIKSFRNLVKGGLRFKALEEEKLKEISKIEDSNKGSILGGIWSLIGYGKRQEEIERLEQEKKVMIDQLKAEIDMIRLMEAQHNQDIEDLLNHTSAFKNLPPDYTRFHILVSMESFRIAVTHESCSLLDIEVSSTTLELFKRISSIKFDIRISKLSIYDLLSNSAVFPKLVYATEINLSVDNYSKIYIDASSSDVYFIINLEFYHGLHKRLKKTLYKEFDVKFYQKKVIEKAEEVYSISQKYVADSLNSGASGDISLNISLKAPVFFFPNDTNSLNSVFVIDLGYIKSESLKEERNGLWYYAYDFILKDLEMVIVRDCTDLTRWNLGKYDFILKPLTVECRLFKSMVDDLILPSIIFESRMCKVEFFLNEEDLEFIVKLGDTYVRKASYLIHDFRYEHHDDRSVAVIVESENSHIKNISAQLLFELDSVNLNLRDSEREVIKISTSNLTWLVDISKNMIEGDIKLEKLEIIDTRQEIAFNYIISNPLHYLSTGSEDDEDFRDAEEEIKYQIRAGFKIFPARDFLELACLISNIRIVIFPEFVNSLERFVNKLSIESKDEYYDNSPHSGRPRKVNMVDEMNAKVISVEYNITASVALNEFELWLPMDCADINSAVANLSFSPVITFNSSREYAVSYNQLGQVIDRNLVFLDDEGTLEIRHLNVMRGYTRNNKVRRTIEQFSDLINPCRIGVDYRAMSKKEGIITQHAKVQVESIDVVFGFRDIFFFKQLISGWSKSESATSETLIQFLSNKIFSACEDINLEMKINCNSLHMTMIEDTGISPYSLVHSQYTHVEISLQLSSYFSCYVNSNFMTDYYNLKLSCWEPLIEDWQFSISAERDQILAGYNSAPILKVSFTSPQILCFNISHSMAETLTTIINKIKLDRGTWARENIEGEIKISSDALAHGVSSYVVVNNLGVPCYSWLSEKGSDRWHLKPGETKEFTQRYIEELRIRQGKDSNKLGLMSGLQQAASLVIDLYGFPLPKGLSIEDGLTKSSKVKYKDTVLELILDITGLGNVRYLSIETSYKVMNNTHRNIIVFGVDSNGNTPESILVKKMHSKAIPASFNIQKLVPCIRDANEELVPLDDTKTIKVTQYDFITIEMIKLDTVGEIKQKIIQVSSPVIFRNSLPCPVEIFIQENNLAALKLNPGDTAAATFVKAMNSAVYKFRLSPDTDKVIESEWFYISQEKQHVPLSGDFPVSSLTIQVSNQNFSKNKDTNLINRVRYHEKDDLRSDTDVGKVIRSYQSKLIEIFFDYILVNKTDYDLAIYQSNEISLPAREFAFFHDEGKESTVNISHSGYERNWTPSIHLQHIGVNSLLFYTQSDSEFNTKLIAIKTHQANAPLFRTKIVSFVPRYMISNLLDFPIYVKQFTPALDEQDTSCIQINHGESTPFELLDPTLTLHLLQFGVSQDKLCLPFNAQDLNDFQIMIPSLKPRSSTKGWGKDSEQDFGSSKWYAPTYKNKFMHYVRIVITTNDNATININFMNPRYPEFLLRNETSEEIICFQESCTEFTIKRKETLPYAFENHTVGTKKVIVKVGETQRECAIDKMVSMKKIGKYGMTVDLNGYSKRLTIEDRDESIKRLKFQRQKVEDKMRERLSIFDTNQVYDNRAILRRSNSKSILHEMGVDSDHFTTVGEVELIVALKGFGLSVIDDKPKETLYLSLNDINLVYKEAELESKYMTVLMRSLLLSLQHVQLDNMRAKKDGLTVIFSSLKRDINQPFLVISIGQKVQNPVSKKSKLKSTSISMLDWFIVKFQEIHIKINKEVIDRLTSIKNKILNTIYLKNETTEAKNEFKTMYEICSDLKTCNPIIKINTSQVTKKIYIDTFQIEPLKISMTFRSSKKKINYDMSKLFGISDILISIGNAFLNVTDAPLYFDSVELFHTFESPKSLLNAIMNIYTHKFLFQTYKLIGSSDMIGNPLSLIDKISTGVNDILCSPIRACRQSDNRLKFDLIAFSQGFTNGITSFLSNTISGSFESVSKITGSLYNTTRQIGGHSRGAERLEDSPNIAVGMFNGVRGIFQELVEGIVGLKKKTKKGCEKGKIGLMKGVVGGVLGVVVSPVSATLRASTEITASLANNAQIFDIAGGRIERSRFPRQFGARGILEPYNSEIAQIQDLLYNITKLKNELIEYYVRLEDYVNAIVVITQTRVMLISKEGIVKKIRIERVNQIKPEEAIEPVHNSSSVVDYKLELIGIIHRLEITTSQYSAIKNLQSVLKELIPLSKGPSLGRSYSLQASL
jgi:hypothetical protein